MPAVVNACTVHGRVFPLVISLPVVHSLATGAVKHQLDMETV